MESILNDVIHGCRLLIRYPGFRIAGAGTALAYPALRAVPCLAAAPSAKAFPAAVALLLDEDKDHVVVFRLRAGKHKEIIRRLFGFSSCVESQDLQII